MKDFIHVLGRPLHNRIKKQPVSTRNQ